MKSRLLFLSAIVAATATFGVSSNTFASSPDAQAPAAVKLGDHPAVVVARTMRRIDPNTFIVAHPARLQLLAASPSVKPAVTAEVAVSNTVAAGR